MRLTTITISGFKSFAKKTVIDVHKNITGIVGPNGSGKSNIAEAIRFVLGEQSMKSMRGSGGTDLIFKGSSALTPLARAVVSLTLSNKESKENRQGSDRIAPFLVYEEIVLAREIFADGGSDYTINGAKVRLKDVEELLALAGIGNNKHTILNQGEADRVLLVSPKERKIMIEEALGLKVFQLRIDESRKKLDKTRVHLSEVKGLEKEIKPHFAYLERQREKIKKFQEEKEHFRKYAKLFFQEEYKRLTLVKGQLREAGSSVALALLLSTLEKDMSALEKHDREKERQNGTQYDSALSAKKQEIEEVEKSFRELQVRYELVRRELQVLQSSRGDVQNTDTIYYGKEERFTFRSEIFTHIDMMKEVHEGLSGARFNDAHEKSKLSLNLFLQSDSASDERKEKLKEQLEEKEKECSYKEEEKKKLENTVSSLRAERTILEKEKELARESFFKEEKYLYTMRAKASELRGLIGVQREKEYTYENEKRAFETLLSETVLFLGVEAKEYPYLLTKREDEEIWNRYENIKLLEKSKFRLEEGGVTSADKIEKEYQKVKERTEYLQKEIGDIVTSEKELEELISEVKNHMKGEYERGLSLVSESFAKYFSTVFPGGEGKLLKKIYEVKDDDEEVSKEEGVDIDLKLPEKKVKNVSAFSGGEKALTAIALLFALAEVSPPPFIVLDETDAPLDEHNAKKYGETLALLSQKSKLLVITHNRETMSHCEMLYGVTLGSDGASKLLSVELK